MRPGGVRISLRAISSDNNLPTGTRRRRKGNPPRAKAMRNSFHDRPNISSTALLRGLRLLWLAMAFVQWPFALAAASEPVLDPAPAVSIPPPSFFQLVRERDRD